MEIMNTAIIICSRLGSTRIPEKAFASIEGVPMLQRLLDHVADLDVPVIVAVPKGDLSRYKETLKPGKLKQLLFYGGHCDDPLQRMAQVAKKYRIKNVIRITHDKVFVCVPYAREMLETFTSRKLDYVYNSKAVPGTGCEIISNEVLQRAAKKYKQVEFVSYAIKACTDLVEDFSTCQVRSGNEIPRLLIDYPEDLNLIRLVFSRHSKKARVTTFDVLGWLHDNSWALEMNRQPKLTVYTCVFNGEEYLEECLESVVSQKFNKKTEYIIVDDHSTDASFSIASKFATEHSNVRVIRNHKNLGLAASSNEALRHARGEYIIRLDADDYFSNTRSTAELVNEMKLSGADVVVPNNYFGSFDNIQSGRDVHHIGGTIFKSRAVNYIKFNDKLRNYEGLDFFTRASKILAIGYLARPVFFYRQRADSMSRTNLEERARIKQEIESLPW